MNTDHEALRARLKALLSKTVAAGCTEAEAMAAAAKAAALMQEYKISTTDLDMTEQTVFCRPATAARWIVWNAITIATNCPVVYCNTACGRTVTFYGLEPGPEIATYLRDVCHRAILAAEKNFKASETFRRRRGKGRMQAMSDFRQGLEYRLADRIIDIFASNINEQEIKAADAYVSNKYPAARPVKERKAADIKNLEALALGEAAADGVALYKGVGGAAPAKLIGGAS